MKKKIICTLLSAVMLCANATVVFAEADAKDGQIKNIIYMIPDGGGMAPFYLADYVKQAGGLTAKYPNATPVETGDMFIKQYLVGSETTYSANNSVTDSAASGTALSSGYKTNNSYVGVSPDLKPHANILEASQYVGKNTGLVVTYEWTNATPAAFSAHSMARTNTLEIGEQIVNQGIDVVFGNTLSDYYSQSWFDDKAFENRGYSVIRTKAQLESIKPGDRVWGKLPQAYYDKDRAASTPNLAELTTAAIRALDDGNENGFFLMVEGSVIDGGGHASNALNMVSEWLAFDAACKVAIEYAQGRDDTLVVILPDHDTGGIKYGDSYTAESLKGLVSDIRDGKNPSGITWEGAGNHTGRNGGIFMYLPEGVPYPDGIDVSKADIVADEFEANFKESSANRIDNTEIAPYLADFIGADLDELTDELFVDVTAKGTYNNNTEIFTFVNDAGKDVAIERNTSRATVDGIGYDLDGKVAVYLNWKFYVPEELLTAVPEESTMSIYTDYNEKLVRVNGTTGDSSATVTLIVTDPVTEINSELEKSKIVYVKQDKSSYNGDFALEFNVNDALVGDYNYRTRIVGESVYKDYDFSFKNMSIEKDGKAVEKMSELKAGDSIDLVLSGYGSGYNGNACICQYDENGKLVSVSFVPTQGEAVPGTAFDAAESRIPATVAENVKSIKGLYWNNSMVPFTGVYVVK